MSRQRSANSTGSLQAARLEHDQVRDDTRTVTGSIDGSSIALTIDQLLSNTTLTGRIDVRELVLQFPNDDGRLDEFTLTPGTGADYNRAVDELSARSTSRANGAA